MALKDVEADQLPSFNEGWGEDNDLLDEIEIELNESNLLEDGNKSKQGLAITH